MLRAALPDWLKREVSITVAEAALVLGVDESAVRKLAKAEAIDAHYAGTTDDNPTGLRINLQSALNYKARHPAGKPDRRRKTPAHRRREAAASSREALAFLRANGSRI